MQDLNEPKYKCFLCDSTFASKKGNITRFNFRDYIRFNGKEELLIETRDDVCWACKARIVDGIRGYLAGEFSPATTNKVEDRLLILENQMKLLMGTLTFDDDTSDE